MPNGLVCFTNCLLPQEDGGLIEKDLWIDQDKGIILDAQRTFFERRQRPDRIIDLAGNILSPGLIDIQINGAYGFDFSVYDGDDEAYREGMKLVAEKIVETGVTSLVPTLITQEKSLYPKILTLLRPYSTRSSATLLGWHAEGPFIDMAKRGAHAPPFLLSAPEGFRSFESAYGSENLLDKEDWLMDNEDQCGVRIITAAPEISGVMDAVEELTKRGIIFSMGHSVASSEIATAAVMQGARLITHLFNAMPQLHHRDPSIIGLLGASPHLSSLNTDFAPPSSPTATSALSGVTSEAFDYKPSTERAPTRPELHLEKGRVAAMAFERPFYDMIVDGIHSHPNSVRLAYTAYPAGCILITDAMKILDPNLRDGIHEWRDGKRFVKEGDKLYLEGTNTLAGSVVTLDACVRNFSRFTGCSLGEAIKCATFNPARCLGIDNKKGTLRAGADADLTVFDRQGNVVINRVALSASEDSALVKALIALSNDSKKKRLVTSSKYAAPADPSIEVTSWKMNEFKYYEVPSPFPTLARGIFTTEDGNGVHRIVARGYDKFFNVGEVGWTTKRALEDHTTGPYTLSLKSNGCIIFIAALTPEKLLITSKHSIGPATDGMKVSHADAGEKWLRKYLEEKGRTESDLANVLWMNNWTAVAELCDDSFEEHVLGYPPELTGLHLHGINESTKAFKTLPHEQVDAFAKEWGFITTASLQLPTIAAVREFTDECAKTGTWNGVPIEGFVVRTHVGEPPAGSHPRNGPPYSVGSTFFFKVKFDEPYMMYRDWRELTKQLLTMRGGPMGKNPMAVGKLSKNKIRRAETKAYVNWVIEEIQRNPTAFLEYGNNKGIVAVRERFLGSADGHSASLDGSLPLSTAKIEYGKTIILPVAIPGCGKTAVSVALSHIFGFAHTQSDDVRAKKPAPVFIKNVFDLLKKHDVVIADKNNHLKMHREALRTTAASFPQPVRLLALHWGLDDYPPAEIHRICADRVLQRGENHQTLLPDASQAHEQVLWSFITKSEPLASDEVDEIVEMSAHDDLEASVIRAVKGCVQILGLPEPTPTKIQGALDYVRRYKPAKTGQAPTKIKGKPRYFAFLPEIALEPLLEPLLGGIPFWRAVKSRVTNRTHVTLIHQSALPGLQRFWNQCKSLHELSTTPPTFKLQLGHVVWNDRIMALTVDAVALEQEGAGGQHGAEFVSQIPEEARQRLHITVATRDGSVAPVEAKTMVENWRLDHSTAHSLPLGDVTATGRVKGLQA
ncbi:unnamed protein product [Mycena citricolor]|uniref:N-acetylglucosamine-6-phosphate deacetylase n=1 Tax=Mycena citricolor TaxID=2018698 RepID=A0AAD2H7C9_9AGAR|nr:unnamed protein product [Mycena citricolor]